MKPRDGSTDDTVPDSYTVQVCLQRLTEAAERGKYKSLFNFTVEMSTEVIQTAAGAVGF